MVVIACRHIRRVGGQSEDIHGGVQASPLSGPLVVGPVGADGTEVFLTTVISLEEEDDDGPFRQTHKMFENHNKTHNYGLFLTANLYCTVMAWGLKVYLHKLHRGKCRSFVPDATEGAKSQNIFTVCSVDSAFLA